MPTPEQMTTAVETYQKCFANADKQAWLGLFTDDCEQIDPYPSPANVGREALEGFWDRSFALGSNFEFTTGTLVTAHDTLVMPFTLSMEAAGARYEFDGVDVFQFADDGRIQKLTAYWDPTKVRPVG
jgi:steroid delta-isomerase